MLSYRNTPPGKTGKTPSFLLFYRVVRDKLPAVPSPVDGSKHDDAVKRNHAQEEKMKTYVDVKRRRRLFSQTCRYKRQIDKLLDK